MAQMVCPHCGREVLDDMCDTCGPVVPLMRRADEPAAPALVAARGSHQQLQPTAGTNMMLGIVLLGLIAMVVLGGWVLYRWQRSEAVKAAGPLTPDQRLVKVRDAIKEERFEAAAARLAELDAAVTDEPATVYLDRLVIALTDTSRNPGKAFLACSWLESHKNFDLRQCGKFGRDVLERRARRRLEEAEGLFKQKKFSEALAAYQAVPDGSKHSGRARRQERELRNELSTGLLEQARKAFEEGKPLKADKMLFDVVGKIKVSRLAEMKQLQAEIRLALGKAARESYAKGDGVAALKYLHVRRHSAQYFGLYKKIQQVVRLSLKAEDLVAENDLEGAKKLWREVLSLESASSNHYHKSAQAGVARQEKDQENK